MDTQIRALIQGAVDDGCCPRVLYSTLRYHRLPLWGNVENKGASSQ
jgi:hypothetical protein